MNKIAKSIASLSLAAFLCCGVVLPNAFARGEVDKLPGFTKELTARQQQAARKIWSETAASRKQLRKALAGKRAELNEVVKTKGLDKAKIESIFREIGELRGKLLVEGLETHAKLVDANLPVGKFKFNDRGGRYDNNNLMPKLNSSLTPEQKAKAQKIIETKSGQRKETQDEITAKRAELAEIMQSATPDKARIETLSAELSELRAKMLIDRVELLAQLKKAGLPDNAIERGGKPGSKKDGVKKERKRKEKKEAREETVVQE